MDFVACERDESSKHKRENLAAQPMLRYVKALEARLFLLEAEIAQLRSQAAAASSGHPHQSSFIPSSARGHNIARAETRPLQGAALKRYLLILTEAPVLLLLTLMRSGKILDFQLHR
jgi:uncharacterized small protein (DUF1192 family)